MRVATFTAGPFGENTYLVWDPVSRDALAVDPGAGTAGLLDALRGEGLMLHAILLTHAHLDHVEGVGELKAATRAPIVIHPDALLQYRAVPLQAEAFGLRAPSLPEPDRTYRGGDRLREGTLELEVVDAPGHAPGHVVLVSREGGFAFVGDVVFAGSIGRTDLPGGDFRTLMTSIREAVLSLPASTRLFPGHGPETTVEHERRFNPFLAPQYGGERA